jgi:hypothetical protein
MHRVEFMGLESRCRHIEQDARHRSVDGRRGCMLDQVCHRSHSSIRLVPMVCKNNFQAQNLGYNLFEIPCRLHPHVSVSRLLAYILFPIENL